MNNLTPQPEPRLITYQTLRQAIGYMGIGLPAVLLLGIVTIGKCPSILDSISHYYYSIMGTFVYRNPVCRGLVPDRVQGIHN